MILFLRVVHVFLSELFVIINILNEGSFCLMPWVIIQTIKRDKCGRYISTQIFLSLVLQEISLVLMRQQYHDVMELLESFDRMTTNSTFRKYKPNNPLHGHANQW